MPSALRAVSISVTLVRRLLIWAMAASRLAAVSHAPARVPVPPAGATAETVVRVGGVCFDDRPGMIWLMIGMAGP